MSAPSAFARRLARVGVPRSRKAAEGPRAAGRDIFWREAVTDPLGKTARTLGSPALEAVMTSAVASGGTKPVHQVADQRFPLLLLPRGWPIDPEHYVDVKGASGQTCSWRLHSDECEGRPSTARKQPFIATLIDSPADMGTSDIETWAFDEGNGRAHLVRGLALGSRRGEVSPTGPDQILVFDS